MSGQGLLQRRFSDTSTGSNQEADSLAGSDRNAGYVAVTEPLPYLRLMFDGSSKTTSAGGGWILYGSTGVVADEPAEWQAIAWQAFKFPAKVSSTAAKMEAVSAGIAFLHAFLQGPECANQHFSQWCPHDYSNDRELPMYEDA